MQIIAEGGDKVKFSSKPAVKVGFCKFTWLGCYLTVLGALCFSVCLAIWLLLVWRLGVYTKAATLSCWYLSALVGVDLGLATSITTLVFLVPRMIMTWITALVFDIFFKSRIGQREMVVVDGEKLAREICHCTFKNAVRGGNMVAITAALVCLLTFTLLRQASSDHRTQNVISMM